VRIRSAIHEILADKAFTATDGLISQSFVVTFVHSTYMWIVLIWGFPVQLSLWKSVHWLWRYKLNEVCDIIYAKLLVHAALLLTYSKGPCVILKINICQTHYNNIILLKVSTIFYCNIWLYDKIERKIKIKRKQENKIESIIHNTNIQHRYLTYSHG